MRISTVDTLIPISVYSGFNLYLIPKLKNELIKNHEY